LTSESKSVGLEMNDVSILTGLVEVFHHFLAIVDKANVHGPLAFGHGVLHQQAVVKIIFGYNDNRWPARLSNGGGAHAVSSTRAR
jgi:hypothetical protein